MEPILAIIGIAAALIGIGAGVVQIIDYLERKRQQQINQSRQATRIKSTDSALKAPQIDNRIQAGQSSIQDNVNFSSRQTDTWMQLAELDLFAIDDCVMILGSENFKGWTDTEMIVSIENTPVQIPDDLENIIREYKEQVMGTKHDGLGLRVISLTPGFKDDPSVRITLSPVRFSSHFTITTLLDKAVLKTDSGDACTIREKYGLTALQYSTLEHPAIPTNVSLQIIIISSDNQLLLMRRSSHVAFYPNAWTVSIEEGMLADDKGFTEGVLRGVKEELGRNIRVEPANVRIVSFCVEYPTLSFNVICFAQAQNSIDEIRNSWRLTAPDKHELSQSQSVPIHLQDLVRVFLDERQWHPSARMRIIQVLFSIFGVENTLNTINEAQQNRSRTGT